MGGLNGTINGGSTNYHSISAIDYEVYRESDGARVVDTNSTVAAASFNTL